MIKAAKANMRSFKPWLDRGYEIISPVPSCSLMLKREYLSLVPGEESSRLSQWTFDICEYMMRLKRGGLSTDFIRNPGQIAYQILCHLRDQNIGLSPRNWWNWQVPPWKSSNDAPALTGRGAPKPSFSISRWVRRTRSARFFLSRSVPHKNS